MDHIYFSFLQAQSDFPQFEWKHLFSDGILQAKLRHCDSSQKFSTLSILVRTWDSYFSFALFHRFLLDPNDYLLTNVLSYSIT